MRLAERSHPRTNVTIVTFPGDSSSSGSSNPAETYLNVPRIGIIPQIVEPEPDVPHSATQLTVPHINAMHTSAPQLNTLAPQPTALVPQINLKRRESGYEADLALMKMRRSNRSPSVCSLASRPPSPLLQLSASDLFLQDDDGRSSLSSSMTSLSAISCSGSQWSNDSGVSVRDRRSVSFSGADDLDSERKRKSGWEKEDRWDDSRSIASCGGRLNARSLSDQRGGDARHQHSGSCSDVALLHPHHACVDPLRSSRCRSVSCVSLNSIVSQQEFSGAIFTAKLYNRIGRKVDGSDALGNISNVCHVYKGMTLLTDLVEGKITFMGSNGRAVKEFITETGSEPWCACVTPKGHVAVTLRRRSCVTVWSGHGSLVREFGHDVLKCPTGLACDYKGRFIVTDERTNRVAIFSDTGKFLRYLGHGSSQAADAGPDSSAGDCRSSEPERKASHDGGSTSHRQHQVVSRVCVNTDNGRRGGDSVSQTARGDRSSSSEDSRADENTPPPLSAPTPAPHRRHGTSSTPDTGKLTAHRKTEATATDTDTRSEHDAAHSDNDDGKPFQFSLPRYVCVTGSGRLVVSDSGSHSVKVFTADGSYLHSIGRHGSGDGQLKVPYGVCCDQHDNIYIADHYNDRVSVFSIDGGFLQHVLTSSSGLSRPKSVAVRSAHDRMLYIAHGGLRTREVLVYRLLPGRRHSVTFKCDV